MSSYCFFSETAQELAEIAGIREKIEQFADRNKKQTYVVQSPLSIDNPDYDYDKALVIFASGAKPCFVDIGNSEDKFADYQEYFIDDLVHLSEKFRYRQKIGRKKQWIGLFESCSANDLNFNLLKTDNTSHKRIIDLIISLVIGSINNIAKISLETKDILDSVKSKIVLFDTDQTGFVFKTTGTNKKFVIQGLAGSGKTELLLHKLKELYSSDNDIKIVFTCYNKLLASSMRNRIPEFFDFMRVERQIDWHNKLFCFHAWGSSADANSGMYRYICHSYGIPFGNLRAGSFDYLCQKAIEDIKQLSNERKYIFDYVFIDESQDFAESFFELCELVTEKKLFIAGDVFQNIFRPIDDAVSRADLILKKCYRTDPKNLMFSHALGMGLFEKPVLRWLKQEEWSACGYKYEVQSDRAIVSRDPLRRFEDIPDDFECTKIHTMDSQQGIAESIIQVIKQIHKCHTSVEPGDIAVLFLDRDQYIYDVIPELQQKIESQLDWGVNVSFETKVHDPNRLFISNINNAKGLEFPFVICFANQLHRSLAFRNGLYTMMARSFLESHLIIENISDAKTIKNVRKGLKTISNKGVMKLRIPDKAEIKAQQSMIIQNEHFSVDIIIRKFCDEKSASSRLRDKLLSRMHEMTKNEDDYDESYIRDLLEAEYKRNRHL